MWRGSKGGRVCGGAVRVGGLKGVGGCTLVIDVQGVCEMDVCGVQG